MNEATPDRWFQRLCIALCCAGAVFALSASLWLIVNIPDDAPLGGPDEPMHRSMAMSIARHLEWPKWDSSELERYYNGGSYATGSTLGYWIEAFFVRLTGWSRLSPVLLLCVYLGVVAYFARTSPVAGILGVAAAVPQVVFVFSYVNSDAWTAVISLLLGVAVSTFRREPTRTENLLLLFAFSAACLTCRQHVWVIGGLTFAYALLPRLSPVLIKNPRGFLLATAVAVIIAAWWPVTSYVANEGDLIGFTAARKARALFGDPDLPSFARPWDQIDLMVYFSLVLKSLYGVWGWGTMFLTVAHYRVALLLVLPILVWICWQMPRWLPLFLLLPLVNAALMLYYSTTYDFQWQGRYLFPSYFVLLGVVLAELAHVGRGTGSGAIRWLLFGVICGLIALNAASTVSFGRQIHAERHEYVSHGLHLFRMRKFDSALERFREALRVNPRDPSAHNAIGLVKKEQHDLEAARMHYRKAIELAPDDPMAYMNLGVSYLVERNLEKAIEHFQAAARVAPDSSVIHYYLSDAYAQIGEIDMAIDHCRRALSIEPGYEPGESLLKNLLLRQHAASQQ